MFVPPLYRPTRESDLRDFVRAYPFALLVTGGADGGPPLATHLPVVLGDPPAALVGDIVFGHCNRMNPQFLALTPNTPALLVFSGPSAYVSPTVYGGTGPLAPTWDYAAVHLTGRATPLAAGADTLAVVRRTVATFERDLGHGWSDAESLDYFDQLLPGVGAFWFEVTGADGMFKLSQEKPDAIRDRVVEETLAAPSGCARDLGRVLREHRCRETGV
jgi:transcriptional regulator